MTSSATCAITGFTSDAAFMTPGSPSAEATLQSRTTATAVRIEVRTVRSATPRPGTARHPRYSTSATTRSLKCHGIFSSPASSLRLTFAGSTLRGSPSGRPHVGHFPSASTELGFQNFEQSSHHGIREPSHRWHAVALLDEEPLASI